ncbi:MAG: helix-turn-helix transcriptional regulator [Candidatus Heritagella sp.]
MERKEGAAMAKGPNRKKKLLLIRNFFLENTDPAHPATLPDLIAMLEKEGIPAERKSLYDDIRVLKEMGMDIESHGGNYYLAQREFTLPELKMLADAVSSSPCISERRSHQLIRKIEGLTSRFERRQLQRPIYISHRSKITNESALLNVDLLHQAINSGRKISFRCFSYTYSFQRGWKKQYRYNGEYSVVSPYALLWDDETYYLLGESPRRGRICHFRVDKMEDIHILSGSRVPPPQDFDAGEYARRMSGLYAADEPPVTLEAEMALADAFYDRFGRDLRLHPVDDRHFRAVVPVHVSGVFLAWVFQFEGRVRILSPQKARDAMQQAALRILAAEEKT